MPDVTRILSQIDAGDPSAPEQLLPLVYDELRKLAAAKLAHEKPGQTLQATALVHEAYLRLVGGAVGNALRGVPEVGSQESGVGTSRQPPIPDPRSPNPGFDSRGHFFAAAATAMRRILIENARRKGRLKHGGQLDRVSLADLPQPNGDDQLLALDEALTALALEDPQAAQVVELHHFAGLSHELVARSLGITVYQARQKWTYARAWLLTSLDSE
jgi:DNA-directed RNA polymerase specialized sigma24 family protein